MINHHESLIEFHNQQLFTQYLLEQQQKNEFQWIVSHEIKRFKGRKTNYFQIDINKFLSTHSNGNSNSNEMNQIHLPMPISLINSSTETLEMTIKEFQLHKRQQTNGSFGKYENEGCEFITGQKYDVMIVDAYFDENEMYDNESSNGDDLHDQMQFARYEKSSFWTDK